MSSVDERGEDDASSPSFLRGGGELGRLLRSRDWSRSPLGPPATWPQSLKTAVGIMLTSRQPIWIGWGPELIFLYNDAYKSIIGGKHPWALGRPTEEVWREIWTDIAPLLATATGGGEGTFVEEQLLVMERNGYPEETYYTFSYSPVPGEDGRPGGIICANSDDTRRVIGERRLALLRKLAAETVDARSWREAAGRSVAALASGSADVTFALFYALEADGEEAELIACAGVEAGAPGAPFALGRKEEAPWPLGSVIASQELRVVDGLDAAGLKLPLDVRGYAAAAACLLPIAANTNTLRGGVLVVGLNPLRILDEEYRAFLDLAAGQVSAALASADAYEEERRRAEALAALDEAKTAFFSNVSHEFRTPLTLMLGPLEEILAGVMPAARQREQVELAHRNGVRLLRLVNSLLDFARIEAGRVRAVYAPVDLGEFSADIASAFRSTLERAGLDFEVVREPLPDAAWVDRDMWEKILLNLLSNAFKFTFEGGVRVRIGPSPDGRSAVVAVSDTGIGIPASELPHLFERFHRVAGARGRSFEGSGIGLALVHELVRLHGGAIRVESVAGEGSTFIVTLPLGSAHLPFEQLRPGEETPGAPIRAHEFVEEALRWLPEEEAGGTVLAVEGLGAIAPASPDASAMGFGRTVLLADDNADMRAYVARILRTQGFHVATARDGEEALQIARRGTPDLILSDVMMPRLDGFGLLREIREDPALKSVPLIMLSARAGEEAKVEGLDRGADDYLVKPFAARELLARVNGNIQLAEIRREASRAIFRSEQKTQITQERLSLALSAGGVGIFEWEVDADAVAVLGPIAELYGVDPAEAESAGLPLSTFIEGVHPEDRERVAAAIFASIEDRTPFRAEYRVTGGGRERTVLASGQNGETAEGTRRLYGVILDVTDLRAAERELQALNARLEERVAEEVAERVRAEEALRQAQKMEAVGQLTGGVAHDFNNLLTVILGGLDTIRRCKPGEEDRVRRAVELATQGAQRAASLTGRLLAFSRRQPLDPRPTDLNVLVRDMTELLHRTLGEQIELEGVLAPRLWTVEVDANQLESAILNLAVNARDAMTEGGKLTIETANTALDEGYAAEDAEVIPGQYVMIAISDTGQGMSQETQARVFEPFFTTKELGRGTGLGLSMVYGFVKQSGGHITLYSEVGHGTTVKLYFPRHLGVPDAKASAEPRNAPAASLGETILVVEDNHDVRAYSVQCLQDLGYSVLEAENADEALTRLEAEGRVDLLFTDVVLPGESGRVLADGARRLRPELKVLFTTGYSRNAIVHHGRLDPGVQLVTKPFTFDQLAERVRDVLDRS